MTGDADDSAEEHGITDDDLEQIADYLRKPVHERSVDDLRHTAEE